MVSFFAADGSVDNVDDEVLLDAATAVSGSGPPYIFYIIECFSSPLKNPAIASFLIL